MGKQVSFDFFAILFYRLASHFALGAKEAKWFISIGAAFLSSIMACLFSQPGDMILTATYNHGGNSHGHGHGHGQAVPSTPSVATAQPADKSLGSIVRFIYQTHGLKGFFFGLEARLAHVASIITFQLVLYDLIKIAMGLPVTGSH